MLTENHALLQVGCLVGGAHTGDKPRSLALHPLRGWLFYTNVAAPVKPMKHAKYSFFFYLQSMVFKLNYVTEVGNTANIDSFTASFKAFVVARPYYLEKITKNRKDTCTF